MHCCSRARHILLWMACLLVGLTGWSEGTAHATCRAGFARKIAQLGTTAENSLASGKKADAWRAIRDAVRLARRGSCGRHRSLGRAHLVLGIIQYRNGRFTRAFSAWQKALRLDRTLGLDSRFSSPRLRAAFQKLKKRLYPTAARPRPRPRPRPVTRPQPTPPPPTTGGPPPPGGTAPRPLARPPRERTPTPYAEPARTSGCATDRDCKGSRICSTGRCRYPRRSHSRSPGPGPEPGATVLVVPVVRARPGRPTTTKGRRYSDKGVLELGLGVSFQWSKTTSEYEDSYYGSTSYSLTQLYFGLDLYLGYFVANRFKLGFYFSVPITKTQPEEDDAHIAWEIDLIAAPGLAFPLGRTVFGFVDFLLGFGVLGGDRSVNDDDLILGVVGGELGLKIALSTHLLMKLALKPIYLFGKVNGDSSYDEIKVSDVRIILALGFSGFW